MQRAPRIRVGAMVWHDDKLLLVRQGRPNSPRWMLPGGGIEPGESLKLGLERELREEIGLHEAEVSDPVALIESIAPAGSGSGRHLIHIVFAAECTEENVQALKVGDPDVHELRLFSRRDLLTIPIHPPVAGFFAEWRPKTPFVHFGPLWAP